MSFSDELDKMFDDCAEQLGVTIGYDHVTLGAHNASTGTEPEVVNAVSNITAQRLPDDVVPNEDGKDTVERVYVIKADDLASDPQPGDRIDDGSVAWPVVAVASQCNGLAWEITTRQDA